MSIKCSFLATCRKEKGTQKIVAKETRISEVYVRMIENGTFNPGRDLLFEFSGTLMSREIIPRSYKTKKHNKLTDNLIIYMHYS